MATTLEITNCRLFIAGALLNSALGNFGRQSYISEKMLPGYSVAKVVEEVPNSTSGNIKVN